MLTDEKVLEDKGGTKSTSRNYAIINLDEEPQVAYLAGILDITVPQVYEARKLGRLPAKTEASYRECIQHYIRFYKNKIAAKSSSMLEAKMEQDIRLSKAREAAQWLEIKKQKQSLIDVKELNDLILPILHLLKGNLVNLSRVHPETIPTVDKMLDAVYSLGLKIAERANIDAETFVQTQLEKEIQLSDTEEEIFAKFGINELE